MGATPLDVGLLLPLPYQIGQAGGNFSAGLVSCETVQVSVNFFTRAYAGAFEAL